MSNRELARRYGVHRRTVRLALEAAAPPERRKPVTPRRSLLGAVTPWIDEILRADLSAPRKQRHTIERIYQRLRAERGLTDVSYSTVLRYVNRRRFEIVGEARSGRAHLEGMVPQVHQPGEEAEVDFCDVWVRLAGEPVKCHLFTMRLSYSGKAVHRIYSSESQEAFMEGHVEAFRVFGGVPTRHIRYDNLKPAVNKVCFGRNRIESQRWVTFRSHYGFDAFYCLPGIDGAHEKGGVEHEGGRFRRAHLVPVPEITSLTELNATLEVVDGQEDARHVHHNARSVGENFAAEADRLAPPPAEDFDCGLALNPTVRRDSRIVVRQNYYSVPARLVGRAVRVSLRANELVVFEGGRVTARHPRLVGRYGYRDDLDHYLEILLTKPGALAGSTALAQARADGVFTPAHQELWSRARATHGDAAGTRVLVEVLLLHRRMPADAVLAGVQAVLDAGATSPELVAIEARKAHRRTDPDPPADDEADHGPVPARRAPLPDDHRPPPSVAAYDQLLSRPPKGSR